MHSEGDERVQLGCVKIGVAIFFIVEYSIARIEIVICITMYQARFVRVTCNKPRIFVEYVPITATDLDSQLHDKRKEREATPR
jgi:hypothetical protein